MLLDPQSNLLHTFALLLLLIWGIGWLGRLCCDASIVFIVPLVVVDDRCPVLSSGVTDRDCLFAGDAFSSPSDAVIRVEGEGRGFAGGSAGDPLFDDELEAKSSRDVSSR